MNMSAEMHTWKCAQGSDGPTVRCG